MCGNNGVQPHEIFPDDGAWKERGRGGAWRFGTHGCQIGKAFGLQVAVISTSPSKEKEVREILAVDHFVISKDEK